MPSDDHDSLTSTQKAGMEAWMEAWMSTVERSRPRFTRVPARSASITPAPSGRHATDKPSSRKSTSKPPYSTSTHRPKPKDWTAQGPVSRRYGDLGDSESKSKGWHLDGYRYERDPNGDKKGVETWSRKSTVDTTLPDGRPGKKVVDETFRRRRSLKDRP